MKKIILISAVVASTLFASSLTDVATKVATDEATKVATAEVTKAIGTESNATESNATKAVSTKDQMIDAAAEKVSGGDAMKKEVAKEVIKAAI